MPPRKRMAMTIVAKPGTGARPTLAKLSANMRWKIVKMTPRKANVEMAKPNQVAIRKGLAEKLKMPLSASFISLRRVLQVGVEHRHHIALALMQTSPQGQLMSEIARQLNDFPAWVTAMAVAQQLPSGIGGSIIDQNDLVLERPGLHRLLQSFDQH